MASVDILMATYNGEQYVREQIESIQAQTYKEWRLLVSDDCSTDDTLGIVRGIAGTDRRIQIVSSGTRYGSAKANFMSLLSGVSADYAMFCDQDDVWLPDKVAISLKRMKELEEVYGVDKPLMVFTDMRVVDSCLRTINESFERASNINPMRTKFNQVLAQSIGAGCTMLINRKAVDLGLRMQSTHNMIMHDWWLSLVCSAFGAIAFVEQKTSLYRQHGANEVGAKEFSVASWLGKVDEMTERQARISEQSGAFSETYKDLLSLEQRKAARCCAAVCSGNVMQNLSSLFRSRAWKSGVRKIGQIIAAVSAGLKYGNAGSGRA